MPTVTINAFLGLGRNSGEMYPCRPLHVQKLGTDMTALIKKNAGVNNSEFKRITAEFSRIVPLFMFHRNEYSEWFGHPLIELPALKYTTHRIPFSGDCEQERQKMNKAWIVEKQEKLQSAVKEWESKPAEEKEKEKGSIARSRRN